MAISKTRKQKLPSAPRVVKEEGKARCASCNVTRKREESQFAATSLMDESEYLCDPACWGRWEKDRLAKGLGPWGDTPARVAARREKSPAAAPSPPLF